MKHSCKFDILSVNESGRKAVLQVLFRTAPVLEVLEVS